MTKVANQKQLCTWFLTKIAPRMHKSTAWWNTDNFEETLDTTDCQKQPFIFASAVDVSESVYYSLKTNKSHKVLRLCLHSIAFQWLGCRQCGCMTRRAITLQIFGTQSEVWQDSTAWSSNWKRCESVDLRIAQLRGAFFGFCHGEFDVWLYELV